MVARIGAVDVHSGPVVRYKVPMPRQITAFSNPLVKQVRGLRDKKNRRREGLFIAEGLRILTEAREAGFLPQTLFFEGAAPHPLLDALVEATEEAGGDAVET